MRIYLPATVADLAAARGLRATRAHALTRALAGVLADDDPEAGEFYAMQAAAADALELLPADAAGPLVRVVVAADVDDVRPAGPDGGPSAVLAPEVPWDAVVSFHVDDPADAEAQHVLRAAIAGTADDSAAQAAAGLDLLWYDAGERAELLTWR